MINIIYTTVQIINYYLCCVLTNKDYPLFFLFCLSLSKNIDTPFFNPLYNNRARKTD